MKKARTIVESTDEVSSESQKQKLHEDLSQLVHEYESHGLDTETIVDVMLLNAEVAASRGNSNVSVVSD